MLFLRCLTGQFEHLICTRLLPYAIFQQTVTIVCVIYLLGCGSILQANQSGCFFFILYNVEKITYIKECTGATATKGKKALLFGMKTIYF